ncbi:MAG TPA: hypothetical protein VID19_02865 [Candidatus Eremiobacteraceae bacterium]
MEVWTTVAAVGTFVVITITAVAAFIQLHHLRASNQLSAMLKLLELEQSPVLEDRFHFVRTQLASKMKEPDFLASLDELIVDRTVHPERHVIAWFEHIGAWMKNGLIDEQAYLEYASPIIVQYWRLLAPTVFRMRQSREPWLLEDFEYLAVRAQHWMTSHPKGNYAKDTSRMPRVESPTDDK